MPTLEEMLSQAKGLIFDCDGTLVDSFPVYSRAWTAGFALSGATMSVDWYEKRNGLSEHVLMDDFERDHGVILDRDSVIRTMRTQCLELMGEHLKEIEVVTSIARRFKGHLPLAVASGGSRAIVTASLSALGIAALFDTVVTFDDVGMAKPAPDLFLEAAQRMAVAPGHCLVFEDSAQGLEAALHARMPVIDVATLIN